MRISILIRLSIGAVLLALAPSAHASIYTISDDRIRSLDINPVLGRGYSIMTNAFQSTCLMVDQSTTPSYNYDCKCSVLSSSVHLLYLLLFIIAQYLSHEYRHSSAPVLLYVFKITIVISPERLTKKLLLVRSWHHLLVMLLL